MYRSLDHAARPSADAHSCAFVLMAKAPRVGTVKTRLVPPLSAEEAAELSRCFIRDMAANIAELGSNGQNLGGVAFAPAGDEGAFAGLLPDDFFLLPQRGADLGERLLHAAEDLFLAGFGAVCLINADSPTLPGSYLSDAAVSLRTPGDRVVLGAADDGGYYLIGLKQPHEHLFDRIDWSTGRVFAQSVERATEIGLDVERLPSWYDVDDSASLQLLYQELLGPWEPSGERRGTGYLARGTTEFLRSLFDQNHAFRLLLAMATPELRLI